MILSRSNNCPYCYSGHTNSCYVVYENGDHCYSCGHGNRKDANYYAYKTLPTFFNPRTQRESLGVEYTFNVKEFDPEILAWLYGYYIYDDTIKKYNIAYCPPQCNKPKSILLPFLNENREITEYQRRFFPKAFYSTPGVKTELFLCGNYIGPLPTTLCIVEDYISALRVGEILPTLALFGTSLTQNQIVFIMKHVDNIFIWMDNDDPGIAASKKIKNKLTKKFYDHYKSNAYWLQDVIMTIKEIQTNKQPKELSPQEIKQTLFGE